MEDLLKILDISEEKQDRWCASNTDRKSHEHLADLAFRLRDEAGAKFYTAMRMLYDEIMKDSDGFSIWWMIDSKPIHWIIASLIAKNNLL